MLRFGADLETTRVDRTPLCYVARCPVEDQEAGARPSGSARSAAVSDERFQTIHPTAGGGGSFGAAR
ncbi:MAG TPA: hypothetical protein VFQ61_34680, partial [Polyangiaceae bacterium]|nr:hypothetical protein [Polyangiaceae bacterium]